MAKAKKTKTDRRSSTLPPWNIRPAKDSRSPLRPNPRNNDARLIAEFETAAGHALQIKLAALLDRIRDGAVGHPGAANLDGIGGPSATAWCETHEQDVERCLKTCAHHGCALDQCRRDQSRNCYRTRDCFGVPVGTQSDRTGMAAATNDDARATEAALIEATEQATAWLEIMFEIAVQNSGKRATAAQRREAEADNRLVCESCLRADVPERDEDGAILHDDDGNERMVPRRTEPLTKDRTNVDGRLGYRYLLCRFCYDIVVRTGETEDGPRLPHIEEIEKNAKGERVYIHDGRKAS